MASLDVEDSGLKVVSPIDPISRYNLVVSCFNTKQHCAGNQKMRSLPSSRVYSALYKYTRLKFLVLLLVVSLVPIANVLVVMLLAALWLIHEKALKLHRKNQESVPDPFRHMVYGPQVCALYRCNNKFLNVAPHLCPESLQTRRKSNGLVPVMFYNEEFKRYYSSFERRRWEFLIQIFIGTLMCLICVVFLYPLFGLDIMQQTSSLDFM